MTEYITTVGDLAPRDIDHSLENDLTPPVIAQPAGSGWELSGSTLTDRSIYYTWNRGTGFISITNNYTASIDDKVILVDASSGDITVALDPTPIEGNTLTIKKIDSSNNTVLIDGNSNTVDGQNSQTLISQYDSYKLGYLNNWFIL